MVWDWNELANTARSKIICKWKPAKQHSIIHHHTSSYYITKHASSQQFKSCADQARPGGHHLFWISAPSVPAPTNVTSWNAPIINVKHPAGLEMGRVKTAFSCDWQEVNHAFRSVFPCFYVVHEGQFYCDFEFSLGFTVYS